MVHVYIANVQNLTDPRADLGILEGLPDERKNKIMGYVQAKDRKQSLGAGLLLKHVVHRYGMDIPNIFYDSHGKPEIRGLYFNLSHSHDYVVCAVSDKPVGCDVEKVAKIQENIAEHFFAENEVAYLNGFKVEERMDEFYRIWTMKESYLKMTGEGLAYGLKQVECRFENTGIYEKSCQNNVRIYRNGIKIHCYIKEYDIPGYKLSICAKEAIFAPEVEEVRL